VNKINADVLRVQGTRPQFEGEFLRPRMFGLAIDTHELVARDEYGAYLFFGNYDDAAVRGLINDAMSGIGANATAITNIDYEIGGINQRLGGINNTLIAYNTRITTNANNISAIYGLLDGKQDTLTAGDNITIDDNNVISATDMRYDDSGLQAQINDIIQSIGNEGDGEDYDGIWAAITRESIARKAGDIVLSAKLNAEESTRETEDIAIRQLVADLEYVESVNYNNANGDVIFTYRDGHTLTINIFADNLAQDIAYDHNSKELVITRRDGSVLRVDVAALVDIYTGSVGANIQVNVSSDNVVSAILLNGSITEAQLTAELANKINSKADASALTAHTSNTAIHITAEERAAWNAKQPAITGGASTIVSDNLTVNRALISNANGKVAVSAVTSTELGYLSGVTSAIQTQISGKFTLPSGGAATQYINGLGNLVTFPTIPAAPTGVNQRVTLGTSNATGSNSITSTTLPVDGILGAANGGTGVNPTTAGAVYRTGTSGAFSVGALPVGQGGIGATSLNASYRVVVSGNSTTAALQSLASNGTSGQVLTSAGANALPAWANAPSAPGVFTRSANGVVPYPGGTATTRYLREDGTWETPPNTNTTYSTFTRTATGLVPNPGGSTTTRFLREDGTWQTPSGASGAYVLKAGDTMTGRLTMDNANPNNGGFRADGDTIYIRSADISHYGMRLGQVGCGGWIQGYGASSQSNPLNGDGSFLYLSPEGGETKIGKHTGGSQTTVYGTLHCTGQFNIPYGYNGVVGRSINMTTDIIDVFGTSEENIKTRLDRSGVGFFASRDGSNTSPSLNASGNTSYRLNRLGNYLYVQKSSGNTWVNVTWNAAQSRFE
jgi:hypothetical protein